VYAPFMKLALLTFLVLGVAACSKSDLGKMASENDAARGSSTESAAPPLPPPSFNEQARKRLTDLGATETPRGLVLIIDDAASGGGDQFEGVVKLMQHQPRMQIRIEGHDAERFRRALLARGVDHVRLSTHDDTKQGGERSRRVELIFSDSDGRFRMAGDQPPTA
jgi:hypothetical protein